MSLPDVNVLVLAHHSDVSDHRRARAWLGDEVNSDRPFVLADPVVSGFLRVVTNPRIFRRPTPLERAIAFVDGLLDQPTCLAVSAGEPHWQILRRLLFDGDARGNVVPDAELAAIAIEHGATVATRDRGFARFHDLDWFDPIAPTRADASLRAASGASRAARGEAPDRGPREPAGSPPEGWQSG